MKEPTTRSGIRTTEFWLAAAVTIGGILATTYATEQWAQVAGIIASALATMGYGVSRAKVKQVEGTALSNAAERVDMIQMKREDFANAQAVAAAVKPATINVRNQS